MFLCAWLVELRTWQQRLAYEECGQAKSPNTRYRTSGIAISNLRLRYPISAPPTLWRPQSTQPQRTPDRQSGTTASVLRSDAGSGLVGSGRAWPLTSLARHHLMTDLESLLLGAPPGTTERLPPSALLRVLLTLLHWSKIAEQSWRFYDPIMRGGRAPSRCKAKQNQRLRLTAGANCFALSGQNQCFGAGQPRFPTMKDSNNDTGLFQILATFGFGQNIKTRAFPSGETWLEALL